MRRQYIDTDVTLRQDFVDSMGAKGAIEFGLRQAREKAQERAASVGGALAPTVRPQVQIVTAIDPHEGEVVVIGSRWAADVPEMAFTPSER